MKGTFAATEVALDAGALLLLLVADVAFHVKPLIVEFPSETSQSKMLRFRKLLSIVLFEPDLIMPVDAGMMDPLLGLEI